MVDESGFLLRKCTSVSLFLSLQVDYIAHFKKRNPRYNNNNDDDEAAWDFKSSKERGRRTSQILKWKHVGEM